MDRKKNRHICLWKKGVSLLCIASLAVFPLSGCTLKSAYQKAEETPQGELDIYQKIELTEEEMDQSHLTMDFKDKVKIDAKITPYHLYKDGISTYYNSRGMLWHAGDNSIHLGKKAKDAKAEDMTYFGKPVEEIIKILETGGGLKAQTKKIGWIFRKKYGYYEISVPFTKKGSKDDVILKLQWQCPTDKDDNPYLNSKKIYCYGFNMENEEAVQARTLVNEIQYEHVPYDTEKSLSFADPGATAGTLREMLQELTGYEYSEEYDIIPVDSSVKDSAVKNTGPEQRLGDTSKIKPFYYYCFYQELDGVPVRKSSKSIQADENTNLSKELREEIKDKDTTYTKAQIDHYCMPYAEIIYNETGIISLNFGENYVSATESGEGKKPVLNLSEVLEPLYEYFDTVVSIDTTVYEIRLGHAASFTDGADGPIRRILKPVWVVKYDTNITGKRSEVKCFDGYTGAPLQYYID